MIRFETKSGSVYEIDTDAHRYRKVGEEWKDCHGGFTWSKAPESPYSTPVAGIKYLIQRADGKDVLTNYVKTVL